MAVQASAVGSPSSVVTLDIGPAPEKQDQIQFLLRGITMIGLWFVLFGRTFVAAWFWLRAAVAVLMTGRYPEECFNRLVGFHRFQIKVMAYFWGLTDQRPTPQSSDEEPDSPIHLRVQYTPEIGRLRPIVNYLLTIALAISAIVVWILGAVGIGVGMLVTLFTGRYPEWSYENVTRMLRVQTRIAVFAMAMTEVMPPWGGGD